MTKIDMKKSNCANRTILETRICEISKGLAGIGTQVGMCYTNQEIIDKLIELQRALAKGVFEKTHAENLRDQDLVVHFEALAKEYGLDQAETFLRFKDNMQKLGYTIGSLINGMKGEKASRRGLKLLSYDKDVKILYNVQLEDEDTQAEYDAIAITPYGLFVVEVKNWGPSVTITPGGLLIRDDESGIAYDLPGRMSVKQALLKKYIGDSFPKNYQSILVFANMKVPVTDWYHQIPIVRGDGVSYKIRELDSGECSLSKEQIADIEQAIMAHHKVQKTVSPVNCDEIIADYATLMAQIESASAETATVEAEKTTKYPDHNDADHSAASAKWYTAIDWRLVGRRALDLALVIIPVVNCGVMLFNKDN